LAGSIGGLYARNREIRTAELEYDLSTGAFGLRDTETGLQIFEYASASVHFTRSGGRLTSRGAESRLASNVAGALVITHNFKNKPFELELRIEPLEENPGFKINITLVNGGPSDLRDIDFIRYRSNARGAPPSRTRR